MSVGQAGSRFWDVSDSTSRSCRHVVTRLISDGSSYSEVVTRPIFRSVGLRHRPDLTGSGSGLNIIKPGSTDLSYNITEILIAMQFVINCPLHKMMWFRIAMTAKPDSTDTLKYENRAQSIFKLIRSTMQLWRSGIWFASKNYNLNSIPSLKKPGGPRSTPRFRSTGRHYWPG